MSIRSRGVTLIELVVFIVIVGVALAGLFAAFNTITAASADPQVRKQALAIAESLMEEVQLKAFTYCDPDDPQAATATSATVGPTGCRVRVEAIGADTAFSDPNPPNAVLQSSTETRYPGSAVFDNVNDYHGFQMLSGILDINNNPVSGLGAYSASIAVEEAGLASSGDSIVAAEALKISITVTGPGNVSITLDGYRTRYAPNALP